MLTIDPEGAELLLALLSRIHAGAVVDQSELEAVLDANSFFVDFYSGWEGCSRDVIRQVTRRFDHPEQLPADMLPSRMAEGFRLALENMSLMKSRLAWLSEFDASGFGERILAYLPAGTPLDSVIHITVDQFNNAFVYQREMGVSLLKGMDDRKTFEEAVSHELHHVCFHYWGALDAARQKILQEHSGRSIAVLHIENLLMEGLANFYCTPGYVFQAARQEPPGDPFQARLARLCREEQPFFQKAEDILAVSLADGAAYEPCFEAAKAIVFDMEDAMLPAGHFLGARMVETLDRVFPRARILGCIQRLADFLPLYNQAALQTGAFAFNPRLVEEFSLLLA